MNESSPTPHLQESNPQIVEALRNEIATNGPITFARFMQFAIYHPEHGYYAGRSVRAGVEGDFLTAPETDPIFGWTVARQIEECWERLEQPEEFTILEAGAGRGTLARDLLEGLRRSSPECFAAVRYALADVSPDRLAEARSRLQAAGFGEKLAENTRKPITGLVIANELLDAFPFHRLLVQDGELKEIYTDLEGDRFVDRIGDLSNRILVEPFADLDLIEGQRLEVSPDSWRWAESLGERIERGYAILIDYGYPAAELYSSGRAEGMLRTYHAHLVSNDPYRYIGNQDITCHVDFTAVTRAAGEGGMQDAGLVSQTAFFAGLGIEQVLMELQQEGTDGQRYANARQAVMHLLDPRGLGRFRVLALARGVPVEPLLRGFSFDFPGLPL